MLIGFPADQANPPTWVLIPYEPPKKAKARTGWAFFLLERVMGMTRALRGPRPAGGVANEAVQTGNPAGLSTKLPGAVLDGRRPPEGDAPGTARISPAWVLIPNDPPKKAKARTRRAFFVLERVMGITRAIHGPRPPGGAADAAPCRSAILPIGQTQRGFSSHDDLVQNGEGPHRAGLLHSGAGDGNRTHVISLGS